jgi:hypothetical protein
MLAGNYYMPGAGWRRKINHCLIACIQACASYYSGLRAAASEQSQVITFVQKMAVGVQR